MCRSAGADRTRRGAAAAVALLLAAAIGAAWAAEDADPDRVPLGVVRPLAPASNPTTPERVALGERLFADPRLSTDGKVACASCHVASLAFTDGRATPVGVSGRPLPRNAPTLLNAALLPHLFWDGRAASLEEQARHPLLHADEMGFPDEEACVACLAAIPEYPPLFEAAFGDPAITVQRVARALAAFQRTLLAGDSRFDRWWAGESDALTEPERRGYRVFLDRGGCAQCHSIRQSYALFTDGDFHNTGAGVGAGLADVGRMGVTGREEDRGAFRTPTLRNVELTAPYMHDGSLATLEAVVDFYVDGGAPNPNLSPLVRPLELDEQDRADLVAFLRALTSERMPELEDCERLLAEGRPREAVLAFRAELDRRPRDAAAAAGFARATLALDERGPLLEAERVLRAALEGGDSPDETRTRLLVLLGRVSDALSFHEEAMALARAEDALHAWRRVREAGGPHDEATVLEAALLERLGRRDEAVAALEGAASPVLREAWAATRYRRGWRGYTSGQVSDQDQADLRAAAETLDELLRTEPAAVTDEGALYRATARHWLGEVEPAREAYLAAARRETVSEKSLRGLRSLLARDLARYRADLDMLLRERPASPTLLYFAGYEALQEGRLGDAERLLLRRIEVAPELAAAPNLLLARVARARSDRRAALDRYAAALERDPALPGLVAEYEAYLRDVRLDGFAAVGEFLADHRRFLAAGPRDPLFQVRVRNNVAFALRDVAASFTSRGPARIHTFPPGAPEEAHAVLREALALYEEAVALLPEDVEERPFEERWIYAGVLNDTGLVLHYFAEVQDLLRAEQHYLRAFALTQGAYQDTYFYNLQFLYGFELDGRDARWLELAEVAKDAILREDPESETGFSPDEFKRTAARRDFERLSAALRR